MQGSLFDDGPDENLNRCRAKLAGAIVAFCRGRLAEDRRDFHAEELLTWCRSQVNGLAPDSPSRILRLLRREGRLTYVVLSRRDSLYRLLVVR